VKRGTVCWGRGRGAGRVSNAQVGSVLTFVGFFILVIVIL
jgi:hypothetical protein